MLVKSTPTSRTQNNHLPGAFVKGSEQFAIEHTGHMYLLKVNRFLIETGRECAYIPINLMTTNINDEPDSSVVWGSNAAAMGYILYQVPVMVAFHAADMLD